MLLLLWPQSLREEPVWREVLRLFTDVTSVLALKQQAAAALAE